MKRTIKDVNVANKRVLLRLDFNVPIDQKRHVITDDTRIMESLSTINYLCEQKAKVIIISHFGRPEGKREETFSLKIVADRLGKIVKNKVEFATDTVGKDAKEKIKKMAAGDILVLENLRFDKREEMNDEEFCKELAALADIYVNDAFGTAHRKHASTFGVAKLLPNAAGFLMGKELKVMHQILTEPARPFVAILGGAKISDKIPVIENLLEKADAILIGGGMSYTFLKAKGGRVGKSLVDEAKVTLAKNLLEKAKKRNVEIVLPVDIITNRDFDSKDKPKKFPSMEIEDEYMGLDIGPKTIKLFKKHIKKAGTVIWNGPVGVFENPMYARGTIKVAKFMAKTKAFTFVGGGDSAAAVVKSGYAKEINHLSTGGGASLMLLEGKMLPGIDVLGEKEEKRGKK